MIDSRSLDRLAGSESTLSCPRRLATSEVRPSHTRRFWRRLLQHLGALAIFRIGAKRDHRQDRDDGHRQHHFDHVNPLLRPEARAKANRGCAFAQDRSGVALNA